MISAKDMADLLYIHDAYYEINTALFGDKVVLGFNEGNFGQISRIDNLIERNASERLEEDDYRGVWDIVNDVSLSPEERAKLLLA